MPNVTNGAHQRATISRNDIKICFHNRLSCLLKEESIQEKARPSFMIEEAVNFFACRSTEHAQLVQLTTNRQKNWIISAKHINKKVSANQFAWDI